MIDANLKYDPYLLLSPGVHSPLVGITLLWTHLRDALHSGKVALLVLQGPSRALELFENKAQLIERMPAPTENDDQAYFTRWFTISQLLDHLPSAYVIVVPESMESVLRGEHSLDLTGYPDASVFDYVVKSIERGANEQQHDT